MRIAALQSDVVWEDPQANFQRIAPWVAVAAASGARLLALPEMYACGFSMATERIGEAVGGPSTQFLREQAAAHGLWIAGSVPERPAPSERPFNTLVLAGPAGELHRYRKIHPFSFAGEHEHYQAGNEFLTVIIDDVRWTFFICYDLRFADEFWVNARTTDAYLVIANWPETRRHHWCSLLTARAIENQAWVVGVNRVGTGGKLRYTGDSRVIDPRGETIAAAAEQETLLLAEIDPALVRSTRETLPFLDDRR